MKPVELVVRERLNNLATFEFCHPIDILSISNQIEEELYPRGTVNKVINDFGTHENAYVRRAILTSFRFIGSDLPKQHIDLIHRGLQDQDAWVTYDAAWILLNMDTISTIDVELLQHVAGELAQLSTTALENFEPKLSREYAAKKAALALHKHTSLIEKSRFKDLYQVINQSANPRR